MRYLIFLLAGCGSVWPKPCTVERAAVRCTCETYRLADDGHTIRQSCDGQELPIRIQANRVRRGHD